MAALAVPDLSGKDVAALRAMKENYERRDKTKDPVFVAILAELQRKEGGGLNFEKSLEVIRDAAREGRCLSYKEVVESSDIEWSKVRYKVGPMLDRMLEWCYRRGIPLLPVIVVNKDMLETGQLRGDSLAGFVRGCERLGIEVTPSPEVFADAEKARVFDWARTEAES